MRIAIFALALACALLPARVGLLAQDEKIQPRFAFLSDPQISLPKAEHKLPDGAVELWRKAIVGHESQLRRAAADSITRALDEKLPGAEAARPELLRALEIEGQHNAARFAVARALIALEAKEAAPQLLAASQKHGADLRQLVEPALARWDYRPARDLWRSRLRDPGTLRRDLLLAIAGLAQTRDRESSPVLLEMSLGQGGVDVRLAAARASGELAEEAVEPAATTLLDKKDSSLVDRLCAAALLARRTSPQAQERLTALAQDREPAVAAAALGTLLAIDPELVAPLAKAAMRSADPMVRQRGADAYIARPTPERVPDLARLLDDPHPDVRGAVRDALFRLAKSPELDAVIRSEAEKVLGQESWRGQEQASLLLGALEHDPAASRLVELLESSRDEVAIATAWALRKLAVEETLPALLDKAQRQTEARQTLLMIPLSLDRQVAHLFEAVGLMHYAPAEPLLRQHVPKSLQLGIYSRTAAIYALGHLHAGKPDEELAKQLVERLFDVRSMPPELTPVRYISAITLGRMKAKSSESSLKEMAGPDVNPDMVEYAIRWAVHEITGEELPLAELLPKEHGGWILEPAKEGEL